MPYLAFQNAKGAKVELGGNSLAQMQSSLEKNGTVAHPELALAFIRAFFARRDLQVKKQKCLQVGDEAGAEEVDDELDTAEEEEEKTKEAYAAACRGEVGAGGSGAAAAAPAGASASAAAAADPYAFLKADGQQQQPQPPVDDDFM
jgi:hypothetical protein